MVHSSLSPCILSPVPFYSHLFTAVVVLVLLLPLPMLSHWLLAASAWIHSTPPPKANGHTCPGEGQICRPVIPSTGQAPGCQSALMAANPWATRYSKTLWEYAQTNLGDEQIGQPNASECIITAGVQQLLCEFIWIWKVKNIHEINTNEGTHRITKIVQLHIDYVMNIIKKRHNR